MENVTNQPAPAAPAQKEPLLAAVGSFFFPGLGQVYNGEGMVKGLLYLIGTLIGSLVLILPGLAVWLYGIYNAYKVADKMKSGTIPVKGTTTLNLIIFIVISIVIDFIFAFVLIIAMAVLAAFIFGVSSTYSGY